MFCFVSCLKTFVGQAGHHNPAQNMVQFFGLDPQRADATEARVFLAQSQRFGGRNRKAQTHNQQNSPYNGKGALNYSL